MGEAAAASGAAPALPPVLVMSPLPTCVGKRGSGGQWLWAGCTSFCVVGSCGRNRSVVPGRAEIPERVGGTVQERKQDRKVFSLSAIQ